MSDICDVCPTDPVDDRDGAGRCSDDNCPEVHNRDQADGDQDGVADVDEDEDGVCGDNWPEVPNPDQIDADHDGLGQPGVMTPSGRTPIGTPIRTPIRWTPVR